MQLSIVIICWNDWKVIENCLRSIIEGTHQIQYEVIVSDNGSTDGSVEKIRAQFPAVRLLENRANLGFAKGNNVGIREARGEYVLILNPDTIVHDGSLDRWVEFADRLPEAGAFGCRVLNPDGTYQGPARPFPTISRHLIAALGLRFLGRLKYPVLSDEYEGWGGETEREVDWQSGCCVLLRGDLLRKLGRFPVRFAIEICRNGYRYFYKYFGSKGVRRYRHVLLTKFRIRQACYGLLNLIQPTETLNARLEMYGAVIHWNQHIDPIQFVQHGTE